MGEMLTGTAPTRDAEPREVPGNIASNTTWTAAGRLLSQGLQFLSGLVLARVLMPEDFGLLASVYLVTGLTVVFFDMGLVGALVYQRDLTDDDLATAFWLNALGGVAFVGCLVALGPAISEFFGDNRLKYLTPLAGLPFLLGIGMVHSALLTREMRFKKLVIAESIAAVVSNGGTVLAAIIMVRPEALVIGPALGSATLALVLWRMHPWRPHKFIRRSSVKRLWGFSGGALAYAVINYFGNNSDNVILGKSAGPAALGYYNRAFNLMLLPTQQIGGILGRVLFPAFAAMGDDLERIAHAYRRSLRLLTTLTFPMLLGLAAIAPGLVPILWGPHWLPTVVIMQVLCVAGLPQVLTGTETWLFESQGRTRLMSVLGLISTGVKIVGVVVGIHWGAPGVAMGILVSSYVCLPLTSCVAYSIIRLNVWLVFRETLLTVGVAGVTAAAMWWAPPVVHLDRQAASAVAVQVLTGMLVYVATLTAVRREVLSESLVILRRRAH